MRALPSSFLPCLSAPHPQNESLSESYQHWSDAGNATWAKPYLYEFCIPRTEQQTRQAFMLGELEVQCILHLNGTMSTLRDVARGKGIEYTFGMLTFFQSG